MSLAFLSRLNEFDMKLSELELAIRELERKVKELKQPELDIPVLLKRGPGRPPNGHSRGS